MIRYGAAALFLLALSILTVAHARHDLLKLPSEARRFFTGATADTDAGAGDDSVGTKWAVLFAGSSGYWNYRHQVMDRAFRDIGILVLFDSIWLLPFYLSIFGISLRFSYVWLSRLTVNSQAESLLFVTEIVVFFCCWSIMFLFSFWSIEVIRQVFLLFLTVLSV